MKTVIVTSNGNAPIITNHAVVAAAFPGESIHYIFLNIRALPDNYNDLITLRRSAGSRGHCQEENTEALEQIAGSGQNCTVAFDHLYGDSVPVFRNYLEYKKADLVVFDQSQWAGHPHFRERDIFIMVMRSGVEVLYIPHPTPTAVSSSFRVNRGPATLAGGLVLNGRKDPQPVGSVKQQVATSIAAERISRQVSHNQVDQMLSDLQHQVTSENILIRQVSGLTRYFMKQSAVQRMLQHSKRELLWLRN